LTPHQLRAAAREEFAGWIAQAPWDLLVTLTSRKVGHPESMGKRSRLVLSRINQSLYGRRWYKRCDGIEAVIALEQQARSSWHSHMLIRLPDHDANDPAVFNRVDWQNWYYRFFDQDISQFAKVRSQQQVANYACKYVLKDGYVDLSHGFDPSAPRVYSQSIEGQACDS
jgi:hypothetical protein